jgi:hypothetical protein
VVGFELGLILSDDDDDDDDELVGLDNWLLVVVGFVLAELEGRVGWVAG